MKSCGPPIPIRIATRRACEARCGVARRSAGPWLVVLGLVLLVSPARDAGGADDPMPGDDGTFRPTVLVRKGPALGTGTIIASVEGATLILTAAHVVAEPGPLHVELNRYNFGFERGRPLAGFPKKLPATIEARDRDTDLAILRVGGQLALPFVARIAPADREVAPGAAVTSIGFDRGERLVGFPSRFRRIDRVAMERGGEARPFLITEHPPVMGRSGGGLFLADGSLIGVCIARAEIRPGLVRGMYSTVGNVRDLIEPREDLTALVARSHPAVAASRTDAGPVRRPKAARVDRTEDRPRAN